MAQTVESQESAIGVMVDGLWAWGCVGGLRSQNGGGARGADGERASAVGRMCNKEYVICVAVFSLISGLFVSRTAALLYIIGVRDTSTTIIATVLEKDYKQSVPWSFDSCLEIEHEVGGTRQSC